MVVLCGVASEVGMRNGLYVELSCAVGCATTTACAAPWSAFAVLVALAIGELAGSVSWRRCSVYATAANRSPTPVV